MKHTILTSGGVQQMLYVNEEYKMRNDAERAVHRQRGTQAILLYESG